MSEIVINIHGSGAPQVSTSTSTKTTLAAEEHTPECPCAHRHEGDKTVRPCASEVAPVIYEPAVAETPSKKRRGKKAKETPGPLASAAGAAVGTIAAAALAAEETTSPCAPFTRVVNDEEKFKVCLARQKKIGPIKNEKALYELIRHDMASRTTECFIVVGVDIHGELRVYSEIARGEIDRVSVATDDVIKPVLGTCSGFFCAHNHPSSKVRPSKADLDLTQAITDATKPFRITFMDHLVCGATAFYSIREHHPRLFKK